MRFAAELRSVSDEVNAKRKAGKEVLARKVINDFESKFVEAAESGHTHLELVCLPGHPFADVAEEAEEILERMGYKEVVVKSNYLYAAW
jgi:hypothetical protein